jgi:ABC-type transport system substrate-binding protein
MRSTVWTTFWFLLLGSLAFAPAVWAATQPVSGGTLIYATGTDPDNLDPANTDTMAGETFGHMIHNFLVRFDAKLNIHPDLASEWTQSKDGMSWTFKLRKGVKFHDGTPFNAEAVKYNLDRFLGPEKPIKTSLHEPYIKSVDVVDEYTVRINLKAPFSFLLNTLAHSASGMVSPTAHKKWGKDLTLHPTGTGPFKFVEWVRGDRVVLERFENYYEGQPRLEKIIVKTVREDSARVMGLESGDYDMIIRVPPEEVSRLKREGKFKVEIEQTNNTMLVGMSSTKKPFSDVRVRQALNYAVDREAIVKSIYQGLGVAISTVVGPRANGYADLKPYSYDPAKAKKLLAEAGYPNGFKTTLWTPKGRYLKDYELSQAVQQQFQLIGIDAKLESFENAMYISLLRKPKDEAKHELFMTGFSPSTGEARWAINQLTSCAMWSPGRNFGNYCNKDVDQMIDMSVAAKSIPVRDGFLRKAQELLVQDPAYIYLLATKESAVMSPKVHGIIVSPLEATYADKDTWKEK